MEATLRRKLIIFSSLNSVPMKLILHLLVILCCIETVYCSSECSNYTVLRTRDRSLTQNGASLCDSSLTPGWHRFMGDAGYAIPTSCVPVFRCGTAATGWMQGSHPTRAEGVVTRTVCYNWYGCCKWSNNIRVKNCGGFYVYELIRPTGGCNLRYCGNGKKACSSSPCRNGGTCHDAGNKGYRCECPNEVTGQQCETNVTTTVSCGEDYMQINLTRRYFPDVDWSKLHLIDKSCRATLTPNSMNLRTPHNGCGTTYREHDKKIAFWNEVRNEVPTNGYGPGNGSTTITRPVISFYCEYGRENIVSTNFSPSKKLVNASEGSFGNFKLIMDLYQTSSYAKPYTDSAYPVVVHSNQLLWVQYEVKNTNADLVVLAENCRATPSNDPNAIPQHVFLQRGCINDSTMAYSYDPYSRVQRFSIKPFRFLDSNSLYVYLHCELLVCHRNTNNSRCARSCISGSRKRRETADMEGSKTYDLSAGPFRRAHEKTESGNQAGEGSSSENVPLIGGLAAFGGVFLLATILLSVKMLRNRRAPAHVTRPPADVTVNSYEQQGVEQDEQVESNA